MAATSTTTASARPARANLTEGPITRHLIRLSWPMIWGILAFVSFQLADTFFIARLGTEPLAAIGFTMPVAMALFNIFLGLAIATSSVLARLIGEDQAHTARRVTGHALILGIAVAALASFGCYLLLEPLFTLMGAEGHIYELVHDYMVVWLWSNLFIVVPLIGNATMRAGGDALTPALILNLAALMNVILDPLLIFGLAGFPRMEIQGAALATVISNFCAMLAVLYIMARRKKTLGRDNLHFRDFKNSCKRLSFIATAAGMTGMVTPIVNGFILAILAATGIEAVAAYGVASRVEAFIFVVLMGLASGMSPLLGQNWGARRFERVNKTLHRAFAFVVAWSLLAAVALAIFARPVAAAFAPDPLTVEIIVLYFLIVPISHVLGNLVTGWTSAMYALGMPAQSLAITFMKSFVLTVPLAWLGNALLGYEGVFLAIAAVNIGAGAGAYFWGWHICRKHQSRLRDELAVQV